MKRLLNFFLGFFLLILTVLPLQAQGKTDVFIFGKDKGSVYSLKVNDTLYLDVQKTVKKMGGNVELFAASKQIKASFKGLYAILTAGQPDVIINAETVKLKDPVLAYRGKIYAPAEFFTWPGVGKALERQISISGDSFYVDRIFNLALEQKTQTPQGDVITLLRKTGVTFSADKTNKHTLQVIFPNAVLKQDLNWRLKDDFIGSLSISQRGPDAVMKVVLGSKGQQWNLSEDGGRLLLKVAENVKTLPIPAATPSASVVGGKPSVLANPSALAAQDWEEEAEEMDLNRPVISAALTPSVTAMEEMVSVTPSIKPAVPTIITAASDKKKMRIMVDPGHGGKDPGAVRPGLREKEVNLAVAKHLYDYLKKAGFDVKLTRDNDTFIPLSDRPKMANNFKADLFVSVHTNATKRSTASGFEVYFRSEKATDKEAADVASFENEALQYEEAHYNFVDALLQSLAKNEYMNESSKVAGHVRNYVYKEPGIGIAVRQANSIRQANFYVLKGVNSPSILVEMGYASNPGDRKKLTNKTVQKRIAQGIGKGVESYAKAEGWRK